MDDIQYTEYLYRAGKLPERYYSQLNGKTAQENYRRIAERYRADVDLQRYKARRKAELEKEIEAEIEAELPAKVEEVLAALLENLK